MNTYEVFRSGDSRVELKFGQDGSRSVVYGGKSYDNLTICLKKLQS